MAQEYQSEIRDSIFRDLLGRVKRQAFGSYLRKIILTKTRAFTDQTVEFEFPVSALIGTNGGGKSTILGAAALAYKSIRPTLFFPKSSIGDNSMSNWTIGYEIVEKSKDPTRPLSRSARFKNLRWARDDLIDRHVLYFGIIRTVPAGEKREFKRLATANYKFLGTRGELSEKIQDEVARILGKDVSHFEEARIKATQQFYVGGNGTISYSEFHFGAGEASVIRMVSAIEAAPENALILIEEIENGLHPVAVRRMVEYLVDVSRRKSIQSIFTTHSEDALRPLPGEAIWSAIDGRVNQGRISIDALRAITGRVDEAMAIFVEDEFAAQWVEGIIRHTLPESMDQIGVYGVNGDAQAHSIHLSHKQNPAISQKLKSICLLDGNSDKQEDPSNGIIKLPGEVPEAEVFNYVRANLDSLSMQLAVALHRSPESESAVRRAVEDVSLANRDPHLLFNQVGQRAGLVPANIVSSAFIGFWINGNQDAANRVSNFIKEKLGTT